MEGKLENKDAENPQKKKINCRGGALPAQGFIGERLWATKEMPNTASQSPPNENLSSDSFGLGGPLNEVYHSIMDPALSSNLRVVPSFPPSNRQESSATPSMPASAQAVVALTKDLLSSAGKVSRLSAEASGNASKAAHLEASLEKMKTSSRQSRAVNSRLRAERNAILSELERLRHTGVRVDDEVISQVVDHSLTYDFDTNQYVESSRSRLNAGALDETIRFDESWRARELDADSTDGDYNKGGRRRGRGRGRSEPPSWQGSTKMRRKRQTNKKKKSRSSSGRRLSSVNRSGKDRSKKHTNRDSHDSLSVTESSSNSNSNSGGSGSGSGIGSVGGGDGGAGGGSSSNFEFEGSSISSTKKRRSTKMGVDDLRSSKSAPNSLNFQSLEQLKKVFVQEIEEKKFLSNHIMSLRNQIKRNNRCTVIAKNAEVAMGHVAKQLHKTVYFLSRTAKRKRGAALFRSTFSSWLLYARRNARARLILGRAFRISRGVEKGGPQARFSVASRFRMWRLNARLTGGRLYKLIRKAKKKSGLLQASQEEDEIMLRENTERRQFRSCFSPRVMIRAWVRFTLACARQRKALSRLWATRLLALLRRNFQKLLLKCKLAALVVKFEKMKARTETARAENRCSSIALQKKVRAAVSDRAIDAIKGRILGSAVHSLSCMLMCAILRAWHSVRLSKKRTQVVAAKRIFFVLAGRLDYQVVQRSFARLKLLSYFNANRVIWALESRKRSIKAKSAFFHWTLFVGRRRRARYLVRKNAWDAITRAFYFLLGVCKSNRESKRLRSVRNAQLVRVVRLKMRHLRVIAFSRLSKYVQTSTTTIREALFQWKIWLLRFQERKRAILRISRNRTGELSRSFRLWLRMVHYVTKIELNLSTRNAHRNLAAGKLTLAQAAVQRRRLISGWNNISLSKAWRTWKREVAFKANAEEVGQALQGHRDVQIKQGVLRNWHLFLIKNRAGAACLGVWFKRYVKERLSRRFYEWHRETVQYHKQRALSCKSLFKISKVYRLRLAVVSLKNAATERHMIKSADLLMKEFDMAREALARRHAEEKRLILQSGVARGKILHIIQRSYLAMLKFGLSRLSRHALGALWSAREAER